MVLVDYFRAADDDEARRVSLLPGGPLGRDGMSQGIDGLALKNMDSRVVMGKLFALVLDVEWSAKLIESAHVWPTSPQPRAGDEVHEGSPWAEGPWVEDLGRVFRDAFAGVDDCRLAQICERWWPIEELPGMGDLAWAVEIAKSFVALARRARDAGQSVYCWSCL